MTSACSRGKKKEEHPYSEFKIIQSIVWNVSLLSTKWLFLLSLEPEKKKKRDYFHGWDAGTGFQTPKKRTSGTGEIIEQLLLTITAHHCWGFRPVVTAENFKINYPTTINTLFVQQVMIKHRTGFTYRLLKQTLRSTMSHLNVNAPVAMAICSTSHVHRGWSKTWPCCYNFDFSAFTFTCTAATRIQSGSHCTLIFWIKKQTLECTTRIRGCVYVTAHKQRACETCHHMSVC